MLLIAQGTENALDIQNSSAGLFQFLTQHWRKDWGKDKSDGKTRKNL